MYYSKLDNNKSELPKQPIWINITRPPSAMTFLFIFNILRSEEAQVVNKLDKSVALNLLIMMESQSEFSYLS